MPFVELPQATGALSQILYAVEAAYGNFNSSAIIRQLRLIGGETLDQNVAVYQSREISANRTQPEDVLGTMDPGGSIPFELSPSGHLPLIWHTLGGTVVTTASQSGSPSVTATDMVIDASNNAKVTSASHAFVSGDVGKVIHVTSGTGFTVGFYLISSVVGSAAIASTPIGTVASTAGSYTLAAAGPFTHVIKGSPTLTSGFSLEKGFTDLTPGEAAYYQFIGNRVDKMSLAFNIDQEVSGSFDTVAREVIPSTTSFNMGAAPTIPTNDPYTSTQIAVLEGVGLTVLGTATEVKLDVNNQLFRKKGFILGDNRRQNLKPGTRMTTGSLKYLFSTAALYNEAINATQTALQITATSGAYSAQILLPRMKFTPNNSLPKIGDSGPIEGDLNFKATYDSATGSDIKITLVTPDSSLIN